MYLRHLLWLGVAAIGLAGCSGCRNRADESLPPLASADPEGADLIAGTVVAAEEKAGGVRLYKVIEVNWFPTPIGHELVMIAYEEKAADFEQAQALWRRRGLTVAVAKVRVARHLFIKRDHRVIGTEPVTPSDQNANIGDRQSNPGG